MKPWSLAFCLSLLLWACQAAAAKPQSALWQNFANVQELSWRSGDDLPSLFKQRDGWWAYALPAVASSAPCCWEGAPTGVWRSACSLGRSHYRWGHIQAEQRSVQSSWYLLLKLVNGKLERLMPLDATCPLDGAGASLTWLDGIDNSVSVAWLTQQLGTPDQSISRQLRYQILQALGLHENSVAVLEQWAVQTQRHGEAEAAVEALHTQSSATALQALWRLSQGALDGTARALVWNALIELDPALARPLALALLRQPQQEEFQAILVHALAEETSGLPLDQRLTELLRLTQRDYPAAVRREALAALVESDDPRASTAVEQALARSS